MNDDWLLVPEAAKKMRKSEAWVKRELRALRLAGSQYGGAWHIRESALDAYREQHMNVAPVEKRRRAS